MTTNKKSNREIKRVVGFHYSRGFYNVGYAVWEDGKISQSPWTKKEALGVLSHGGRVFSGHRNCPGKKANPFLIRALEAWAGNWYSQIDRVYGPSSWTVDISVREGRVYANGVEVKPETPGPQNLWLPGGYYMGE